MSDELIVAYIAATVSLIGLAFNALISGLNHLFDEREKQINHRIHVIEEYYAPLTAIIDELVYLINQYKPKANHLCLTNDLINDIARTEDIVPAEALSLFENIKIQITYLNKFFHQNKYQFFPDYHLKRLHDIIRNTTKALVDCSSQEQSCQSYNNITQNFLECLELFSKRLCKKTVMLYTHNIFYWVFPNIFVKMNNILK